jgi:hypothetical protein
MRTVFALLLAVTLGACGSDGSVGGGGGDDMMSPDAPPSLGPPALELTSPDIMIDPGQEISTCWYFRTPNTKTLAINRWQSSMTPGSHHLIMYTTPNDMMQPGTVSVVNCGPGSGFAAWVYSAQDSEHELLLPDNDGTGKPLAMELAPNTSGFIQMHFANRSDQPIMVHVSVRGYTLTEGAAYTNTAAFVTYNGNINIPPGTTMAAPHVESMTCSVPTTSKFWTMTTHTHKQAISTDVKDGPANNGTVVYSSTGWEHPDEKRWDPQFYMFGSGKLTYECTYVNPTTHAIRAGESVLTDEMCMASGYFFPATKPVFCYNNIIMM